MYVSGRVVDSAQIGVPVKDAPVSLFSADEPDLLPAESMSPLSGARTLANGSFVLKAPKIGVYRIVVNDPDRLPINRAVSVRRGGLAGLQLVLERPPVIRIQLIRPDGQRFSPNLLASSVMQAWIWVEWRDRGARVFSANGEQGFEAPQNGLLEISLPGDLPFQDVSAIRVQVDVRRLGIGEINLNKWPVGPTPIRVAAGTSLSGTVFDAQSKPLPHAIVRAARLLEDGIELSRMARSAAVPLRPRGAPYVETSTDENGHYSIPDLFRGEYYGVTILPPGAPERFKRVRIESESPSLDFASADSPAVVSPFDRRSWMFRDVPLAAILVSLDPVRAGKMIALSGKITELTTKKPVPGALVTLMTPGLFYPIDVTITDSNGSYSLRTPPGKRCWIRVDNRGYLIVQKQVLTPTQSLTPMDLVLRPRPGLRVKVRDASGIPVTSSDLAATIVCSWGEDAEDAAWGAKPEADGEIQVAAPRWWTPFGEESIENPSDILIGLRSVHQGFGEAHFAHWPVSSISITLKPTGRIIGVVLNGKGTAVPYQRLSIERASHTPAGGALPSLPIQVDAVTDAAGRFAVTALPPGTYAIWELFDRGRARYRIVNFTGSDIEVVVKPPSI